LDSSTFLITGASGQLGRALQKKYPRARATDSSDLDITDPGAVANFDWSRIGVILNAAAYTDVDGAEMPEGEAAAWKVNDQGVENLASAAKDKDLLLVHLSTDYVFDGTKSPHLEDEAFSPLGVYGKTKAAGDQKAAQAPKNYILRTSWVIGEGRNFVRTMLELGRKGVNPAVVNDQVGRPTFTSELVRAIDHLLRERPPFGTYNLSNGGDVVSWADFTREIFKTAGFDNSVTDTTTADYYKDRPNAAKRPLNSVFDLSKIESTGFKPTDWRDDLKEYVTKELDK
jgi:dTDP-4-dehydrorhamnose 3,5-epimerase/reductase